MEPHKKNLQTEEMAKQPWTTPQLKHVGHVGNVLQGGAGKLTLQGGDPGDQRKPSGGG
jgi:hypothetical protein